MEKILSAIKSSIFKMDHITDEIIKTKNVKLGLRNEDGSNVITGITTKGSVLGYVYEIDESERKLIKPIEGKLAYCGIDINNIINALKTENRFGFEPEVTAKLAKKKCRIVEVPISYYPRTKEEGKKIGFKDGVRAIYCIIKYRGR